MMTKCTDGYFGGHFSALLLFVLDVLGRALALVAGLSPGRYYHGRAEGLRWLLLRFIL